MFKGMLKPLKAAMDLWVKLLILQIVLLSEPITHRMIHSRGDLPCLSRLVSTRTNLPKAPVLIDLLYFFCLFFFWSGEEGRYRVFRCNCAIKNLYSSQMSQVSEFLKLPACS